MANASVEDEYNGLFKITLAAEALLSPRLTFACFPARAWHELCGVPRVARAGGRPCFLNALTELPFALL